MYHKGGLNVGQYLDVARETPYVIRTDVIRTDERLSRYYARLDTNLSVDQIKQKHRGQMSGRSYGL